MQTTHNVFRNTPRRARRESAMSKFYAYRKVADNVFMEIAGVNFEDFEVGQIFEHRPGRTFTAEENRAHIMRSADLTMRNADLFYNEQAYGGEQLIGESWVLTVVTALTTKTFNKVVANLGWKN